MRENKSRQTKNPLAKQPLACGVAADVSSDVRYLGGAVGVETHIGLGLALKALTSCIFAFFFRGQPAKSFLIKKKKTAESLPRIILSVFQYSQQNKGEHSTARWHGFLGRI